MEVVCGRSIGGCEGLEGVVCGRFFGMFVVLSVYIYIFIYVFIYLCICMYVYLFG